MLVELVPLLDDGTRDESLQSMTVDAAQVNASFPAVNGQEQEVRRLSLFRDAQRLFEADPAVWERMQNLMSMQRGGAQTYWPEPKAYEPQIGARRELHPILNELHERLFPDGLAPSVTQILIAPQDRTVSFGNAVDWTIWHLEPATPDGAVYNNGQPFGNPLIEVWRDGDADPWPGTEVVHERP